MHSIPAVHSELDFKLEVVSRSSGWVSPVGLKATELLQLTDPLPAYVFLTQQEYGGMIDALTKACSSATILNMMAANRKVGAMEASASHMSNVFIQQHEQLSRGLECAIMVK